jgi:L-lactate dehydrogenase
VPKRDRKVVVVGAGSVGTTYVYALIHTGLATEIVLIDADQTRVEGEVMDLSHGLPFIPPVTIRSGDYSDCADANLIVVTAGAKQSPSPSRTEVVERNAEIILSITAQIREYNTDAVLLMVTNPVDVLTQLALQSLNWLRGRVIGSGTVLDSARFRYMLSRHCGIDARNIHAYVLGEHGDSEVVAWSMAHIAGVSIREYCATCKRCPWREEQKQMAQQVRDSAYHIIDYKGATYYAIGLALARISGAILRNEHSVLTVSSLLRGEYEIDNICLSVPCIIGEGGIERIITAPLSKEEQAALKASAQSIHRVSDRLKP